MEWIMDPTAWVGLATLIVLEIVLGIDNLVFVAILAEKLEKSKRDKARILGLALALVMRLLLLTIISFIATLKQPLFTLFNVSFSGRQIIMLLGGLFLLYKATMELNERLEGKPPQHEGQRKTANFWAVIAQIIILDAVFSLDSIITAVGIVSHLPVMMIAISVAMLLMIIASKPLTQFVSAHPTVIILCLSFLLMIGFSLVAEGFNFYIPKGYLYAAIGFSILIEIFNQLALFNRQKFLSTNKGLRQLTADAILNLLSGKNEDDIDAHISDKITEQTENNAVFNPQERNMIERVLGLAERTVSSIMTSRHNIDDINLDLSEKMILDKLRGYQHTRIIVTNNNVDDEPIGIVNVNDLLAQIITEKHIDLLPLVKQPLIFLETVSLLTALDQFKKAKTHFAFIVDEFGSVQGIVSITDIMETIAGELSEEGETLDARHDIQACDDGGWIANGYMPLDDLVHFIDLPLEEKRDYQTIAGLLMEHLQHIPTLNESIIISKWQFTVLEVENHRIVKVKINPIDE